MRTVREMVDLAVRIRVRMLNENKDPYTGQFQCTRDELLLLRKETPPYGTIDDTRDRICGLQIISY